jgi:hypothetical protein
VVAEKIEVVHAAQPLEVRVLGEVLDTVAAQPKKPDDGSQHGKPPEHSCHPNHFSLERRTALRATNPPIECPMRTISVTGTGHRDGKGNTLDGRSQAIRSVLPDKLGHVGPVADAWAVVREVTQPRVRPNGGTGCHHGRNFPSGALRGGRHTDAR